MRGVLRFSQERWAARLAVAAIGCTAVVPITGCSGARDEPTEVGRDGESVVQVDDVEGPEFRWTGNGQRTLGTIRVRVPSVVRWVNDTGYSFALRREDRDGIPDTLVSTEQRVGSVPVEPGLYRRLYMSAVALGSWEIVIEPR